MQFLLLPVPFFLAALGFTVCTGAVAAPYVPQSDDQVVERLPLKAADRAARELVALRAQWRSNPRDPDVAVALASSYFAQAGAEGDPRYVGYAQSALQHWWNMSDPPPAVRVQRAIVYQYDHRFDEALADLAAASRADPDDALAWSWSTAIHLVRANLDGARRSCEQLAELADDLVGVACRAQIAALTGRAAEAAASLRSALQAPDADPALRLWALTRLAETEERRGDAAAAERAYREALALQRPDVYLHAAYADFLLDQGRPAEVLALLKDQSRADVLLLRLAIAAKAVGDPRRDAFARELAARFEAAHARGDTSHQKEESRFALAVQGQAARALELAVVNFSHQKELADARILLEAAVAARQGTAAEPALQWMATTGIESPPLHALAAKLKEQR